MTTTETATNVYTIPADHFEDFSKNIAKMNRKAVKLGCEPIVFTKVGEKEVERTFYYNVNTREEYSRKYKVKAIEVVLTGAAPKLEGFQFIARIEYLKDRKSTLFHTVPGSNVKIDERFRALDVSTCEHCNLIRRRNDTFVVLETATGKQTQVGRQCLADFTGINDPEKVAAKASGLSVFENLSDYEEMAWGRVRENTIDTMEALALTSAYIGKYGWVPKSQAEFHNPTANNVEAHFFLGVRTAEQRKFEKEMTAISEEEFHQERAKKVLEWIKTELSHKAKSDYELNLVTLVVNELTERRHLGIVCSAVAAYQRAMNQKVEYAARKEKMAASEHVGTVGERLKGIKVKVQFLKSFDGAYGATTLIKFITEDGNVMAWFASGDKSFEVGQEYTIDGTVKGHNEYQGIKETAMSRVKVK